MDENYQLTFVAKLPFNVTRAAGLFQILESLAYILQKIEQTFAYSDTRRKLAKKKGLERVRNQNQQTF